MSNAPNPTAHSARPRNPLRALLATPVANLLTPPKRLPPLQPHARSRPSHPALASLARRDAFEAMRSDDLSPRLPPV